MAKVDVLNWSKQKIAQVDLPDSVFGCEVRPDLFNEVVKWQLACRRAGTHSTKTRAFVSGGGKKPFKQKGTGQARQGSSRSPLMPGGAILFGPQPRDYSFTLPRKVKKAGLRSALSYLLSSGKLMIVEDMKSEGKAKELASRLSKFGVKKAVLVDLKEDAMFKRAARNLAKYRYYSVEGINVFDLLKYDTALITKSSVEKIVERCE